MKAVNNSILRSVFAMMLGFVLVLWPEVAVTYLVITIGVLFILPGLFSLLNYFTRNRDEQEVTPMFPIDGAGSILLGIWLVLTPAFFVNILMYVLGGLLILAGVQQVVMLVRARKWSPVPIGFYLVPFAILIVGVVIVSYPFATMANTFVLFGAASIIYGLTELINWYKFKKRTQE
ncbi:MAG: DUF308 domain-containing protein [Tannerellaceae bacterium]